MFVHLKKYSSTINLIYSKQIALLQKEMITMTIPIQQPTISYRGHCTHTFVQAYFTSTINVHKIAYRVYCYTLQ